MGKTTTVEGLKVGPIRPRMGRVLGVMKDNRKSCKMQDLRLRQRSLTLPETRHAGRLDAAHRPP